MNNSTIAFIGAGNMANSLIRGLLAKGAQPARLLACDPDADKLQILQEECGINSATQQEIATRADVIVLAVKPQIMKAVCEALAPLLNARQCLIISIAAGIPLRSLSAWLGQTLSIVRCMPNTPALISAGASGLFANETTSAVQKQLATDIMAAVGIVCWLSSEDDIDTVTALSGSGPAYYFLLMEAMEKAAIGMGLPRDVARQLTLQTALGAAQLALSTAVAPDELRRQVTSPGGTTEQAVATFMDKGFVELVKQAMQAAQHRSVELAKHIS